MKVIIFGTGKLYESNKYKFQKMTVAALVDNDPDKQGTCIDGISVISPQQICKYQYDYILLVSRYYREMRSQLVSLGIQNECILDRECRGSFSGIRNIEVYRKVLQYSPKGKILLISHDLALTGAPIVLYNMALVLQEHDYEVVVYSDKKESLLFDFLEKGISVLVFEDFDFNQEETSHYFSGFDLIIANTVTLYRLVMNLKQLQIPVIWWLHEEDNWYKELDIKSSDLETGNMVFPYGVSNRAIQSYCKYAGRQIIDKLVYGIPNRGIHSVAKKESEKAVFAVIGTVDKRKAQDVFVDAVKENWDKWKETAEFWIIGNISEELQKKYGKLGIIKILGELNHEELMEIYQEIDVVVCPSRNDPLPVTLAEGMMNKKVCIASDMTGTAEYIKPYENGLLCKAGDIKSLADSMQWALDHRENWEDMGEKAYQVYADVFSMGQFKKNVLQIVKKHLRKKEGI